MIALENGMIDCFIGGSIDRLLNSVHGFLYHLSFSCYIVTLYFQHFY